MAITDLKMRALPGPNTPVVSFFVPGAVRGKGRPRAVSFQNGTRLLTDAKTRAYEAEVKALAWQAKIGPMFTGPVSLTMVAYFKPPKSTTKARQAEMLWGKVTPTKTPDADNILKIADALNGVIFEDDKQIMEAFCRKAYAQKPGLRIYVFEI